MMPDRRWGPAPRELRTEPGVVDVWRIPLDRPDEILSLLERTLSADERQRAERFRLPQVKTRFIAGRGALRAILGRYRQESPDRLVFRYEEFGKPGLDGPDGPVPLRFNLTHSHGLALLAIAHDQVVGIDLERVREMAAADRIVFRYFTEAERAAYFRQPEAEKPTAFFRGWTRKEAYMKATGKGLTMPLDSFSVTLAPDEEPRLLHVRDQPREVERWAFREIDPGPGFLGALAVEGGCDRIRLFEQGPD
jgi:4'-phosphopantetheinyl transferase